MDFLLVTLRSMFVDHFAGHGIDHAVHKMLRQSAIITFVNDDISSLMIGQNILIEVAVKRPGYSAIVSCNHGLLVGQYIGNGKCL